MTHQTIFFNPDMSAAPDNEFVVLLVDSGFVSPAYDLVVAKWCTYRNRPNWLCIGGENIENSHTGVIHGWADLEVRVE